MYRVSWEQLNKFAIEKPVPEIYNPETDQQLEDVPCGSYYMSEMGQLMTSHLRDEFNFWCDEKYMYFDPDHLDAAFELGMAVVSELDTDDDTLRNRFELGGDDSYDYNGSYITIVVDLLRAFAADHDMSDYEIRR